MWTYRTARERRALLLALTAAGPPGMSLCGLSLATDLPEPALQALLVGLKANGQVRQLSGWSAARYQCTIVAPLLGPPEAATADARAVTVPYQVARSAPDHAAAVTRSAHGAVTS